MSKSTLTIRTGVFNRTVEVPCRLPEAFTFWFHLPGYGKAKATAYLTGFDNLLSGPTVDDVELEVGIGSEDGIPEMDAVAGVILGAIKSQLGIYGGDMSATCLPAIALAYEAEVAAYDAAVKAHASLPRVLHSPALVKPHPDDREYRYKGDAALMLAKYVEHVVEQACKAQTERAEQDAKAVAP